MLLAAQVFAQAGLASPVVGSIVVGAVNTGGTLLAASLIDRAGRRTLLLTSHIAMAVCLAALAAANLLPGVIFGYYPLELAGVPATGRKMACWAYGAAVLAL